MGMFGGEGWGTLGYNEIEVIGRGLFEHRILFPSSLELQVHYSGFSLSYDEYARSDPAVIGSTILGATLTKGLHDGD